MTNATDATDATDTSITLRPADQQDIDRIEALLKASDLPHEDVRAKRESFFLAAEGGEVVGVGGVERHGPDGLLRSVVVTESRRGQGHGSRLTDALETHARTDGVETLYLLTTTAAAFFRGRGYEEIARKDAPPEIRETAEFTELCPASATCMKKSL